jgi:hypothetical protein
VIRAAFFVADQYGRRVVMGASGSGAVGGV